MNRSDVNGILVVAQTGIGNLVMMLPMLQVLRSAFPGATFDFIVNPNGSASILRALPATGRILEMREDASGMLNLVRMLWVLRRRHQVVVFRFSRPFPFERRFLAMKQPSIRAGYTSEGLFAHRDDSRFNLKVQPEPNTDEIEVNVCLAGKILEHCGVSDTPLELTAKFPVRDSDRKSAGRFALASGYVCLHPLSAPGQLWKRWPEEYWIQLIGKLMESRRELVIFGSEDEKEQLKRLFGKFETDAIKILTNCTIMEAAAIIENCALIISNDSGLMHIASLLEVPQIVIWGPTDFSRTKPHNPNAVIFRKRCNCNRENLSRQDVSRIKDCDRPCLTSTSPLEVFRAAKPFLG